MCLSVGCPVHNSNLNRAGSTISLMSLFKIDRGLITTPGIETFDSPDTDLELPRI